jgi:hypothetical protein
MFTAGIAEIAGNISFCALRVLRGDIVIAEIAEKVSLCALCVLRGYIVICLPARSGRQQSI